MFLIVIPAIAIIIRLNDNIEISNTVTKVYRLNFYENKSLKGFQNIAEQRLRTSYMFSEYFFFFYLCVLLIFNFEENYHIFTNVNNKKFCSNFKIVDKHFHKFP